MLLLCYPPSACTHYAGLPIFCRKGCAAAVPASPGKKGGGCQWPGWHHHRPSLPSWGRRRRLLSAIGMDTATLFLHLTGQSSCRKVLVRVDSMHCEVCTASIQHPGRIKKHASHLWLQDLELDENVDVIVSEWMGYMLLYEVPTAGSRNQILSLHSREATLQACTYSLHHSQQFLCCCVLPRPCSVYIRVQWYSVCAI